MILRILASLILSASLITMPFYFSLILAILFIFYFRFFLEALVLMLLSDLIFGVQMDKFWNIRLVSFLICLIIFIFLEILKKRLILKQNDF